jgi:hypothetical protein
MTNKTQSKAAAKSAKQSTPAAVPAVNVKALHSLIAADYRAMLGENKAGMTAYGAFRAVVELAPLSDAKALTSMLQDMKLTFTDAYVDKYVLRATIINNARKVVHGGTKDKHVVQGRGRQALIEVLDSVSSIRELRKAMSAAKPEALKEVKSADDSRSKAAQSSAKAKADKAPSGNVTGLPSTAPDAFAVAMRMLQSLESFFNPSQSKQIELIEATVSMLKTEEIKARLVKAA